MKCCKKAKQAAVTLTHIAQGYSRLVRVKKYEFTDDRIRVCRKCDQNYWIGRALFCSICKCFVPAKARVEGAKCPLGKWENED